MNLALFPVIGKQTVDLLFHIRNLRIHGSAHPLLRQLFDHSSYSGVILIFSTLCSGTHSIHTVCQIPLWAV